MRQDNAKNLGEWFFEDVICRWGCPQEVVTDNAPQMKKMLKWLESKYGIRGIRISPYNSQGNGKIERAHFDIHQALVKATGGDIGRWSFFLKHILWADCIMARRGFGCSPYFIVTGAEPMLPFDIVESTYLVNPPNRVLTREELIGFRAQALSKHRSFVERMRNRIDENKRRELKEYERKYRHTIKDWDFKPGTLVQVRHTSIEKDLDRKMYPRYLGPLIVIQQTRGGSYIVAEMDGTVLKGKVGAFRVLPHVQRYEPIVLPEEIKDLIDMSMDQLEDMADREEKDEDVYKGEDFVFDAIPNLRLAPDDDPLEYTVRNELDKEDVEIQEDEEDKDLIEDRQSLVEEQGVRTRAMRKKL